MLGLMKWFGATRRADYCREPRAVPQGLESAEPLRSLCPRAESM